MKQLAFIASSSSNLSITKTKSHSLHLDSPFLFISLKLLKMELSFIIGVIGNVISVLVFLSPIDTFWKIIEARSTGDFESLPYICTLLNSSLWTYYGLIKPGAILVATVNGFGVVTQAIYITIFLIYAQKSMKIRTTILVAVLNVMFFVSAVLVTSSLAEGDLHIQIIGLIAAGLNVVMYGSPLAAMKTVVTTRSVQYMPFFLSFFLFLNGGIWAFYAILVRDPFLGIPNGAGFILGIAQLVLYTIYRNAKPSKSMLATLEDGRQHEPLLSHNQNAPVLQ